MTTLRHWYLVRLLDIADGLQWLVRHLVRHAANQLDKVMAERSIQQNQKG